MNNYEHLNLKWILMGDFPARLEGIKPGMFIKNPKGDVLLIGDRVIEECHDIAGPGCGCCAVIEDEVVAVALSPLVVS